MTVDIEIPQDLSHALELGWGDVPARAREAVASEAYRSGAFSLSQVGKFLGHASRWETEAFLKDSQAWLDYSPDDVEEDVRTYHSLRDAGHS